LPVIAIQRRAWSGGFWVRVAARGPPKTIRALTGTGAVRARLAGFFFRCGTARSIWQTAPVMATLSALFTYPVKSMRGSPCERARLAATGLEWDRQWLVIDANDSFLTQRTHPKLARIVPEVTADALLLSSPGLAPLRIPFATHGERLVVRIWRDSCVAVTQGRDADAWVSEVLGAAVRVVRAAPDIERHANAAFAGATPAPIHFPDGYPVLVCNEASLADLNRRLPEAMPMVRFRPNLVLSGLPAWAEDEIDTVTLGAVTLRLVKPCVRCTIPSLNHLTGEPAIDPMPVLRVFRWSKTLHGILFGENAVVASGVGTTLYQGMPCRVSFEAEAAPVN
jgi:uncharacterized protein YcbX